MSSYSNKVVWITGASSGIGEALAKAFAKEGAKLILSARQENELQRVKKAAGLSDENCLILPFDLADTSTISSLTETAIKKFSRIDVLVNNGGVSQRSFTKDTPLEIDRKLMEINYFGTIAITKSVLPFMLKQKSGEIIAMSSVSGKFGYFLRSAYSASKHALHGFFDSLRMEVYNDNIHVMIACPGKIKTNISVNAVNEKGQKNGKMDEYERTALSPDECAKRIITALKNRKEEVYIGGPKEGKALWLKRIFPKMFSRLIRKQKIE